MRAALAILGAWVCFGAVCCWAGRVDFATVLRLWGMP